jgi:hypothetical protein
MASSCSPRSSDSVRSLPQLLAKRRQQLRREFHHRNCAAGDVELRSGAAFQQALERAQHSPTAIALHRPRAPAEAAFVAAYRHQRREPLPRLPIGRFKTDQGTVSTVRRRGHDVLGRNRFQVSSGHMNFCNLSAFGRCTARVDRETMSLDRRATASAIAA